MTVEMYRDFDALGIERPTHDPRATDFIPQMIALFRAGRFPFDKLIQTYPFAHINEAVQDQLSGRTIKAVLSTELIKPNNQPT